MTFIYLSIWRRPWAIRVKSSFRASLAGAQVASRLRNRAGGGIRLCRSTWPRWLLRAMKIVSIVGGDDQCVDHRQSPRAFRRHGVYLTTLPPRWRLALPAHGDDTTANLKAIMAAECAAELLNWSKESRASIRALICL